MWAFAVILFAAISGLTNGHDWSYESESKWPGVCTTGYQQSPINIMPQKAIVDKHGTHIRSPLVFQGYESVNAYAANDGHVEWLIEKDTPPPTVSGGPLRGNYSFVKFHLHWLSEHAIDGMRYPMEIHFVHVKTGLTSEEALERPDGMMVFSVFAEVHDTRNKNENAMKMLEPALPYLKGRTEKSLPASVLDLTRMFSPNMQSYYTYFGSLTTPDCNEVVTWIVMDKPIRISDRQYKLFTDVNVDSMSKYRNFQPVNKRVFYRSRESSATIALPSELKIIDALVNISPTVAGVKCKGVCNLVSMRKRFFGSGIQECSVIEALKN